MSLSEDLRKFLMDNGALEVGYADISSLTPIEGLDSGIVIYMAYPKEVIETIDNGPSQSYWEHYDKLNSKLDEISLKCEKYLIRKGFKAYAQSRTRLGMDFGENNSFELPHKTIATNAGLGWIGKSALFVTKEYGSAIRLSSILTDAKLDFGNPIKTAICGSCTICKDACPGDAISGIEWNHKLNRDQFFNHKKCENQARIISKKNLGHELTICGKCIYVCPYTQRFIKNGK